MAGTGSAQIFSAERDLRTPPIRPELIGRAGIGADIDAALFCFCVELALGTDAKRIIRSFLVAFDIEAFFRNGILVLGGNHGRVPNIPPEGFGKRIDQGLPDVGFLAPRRDEGLPVGGKIPAYPDYFIFALIKAFIHIAPAFIVF